ncbi:Ig-like domain-containing protein, partial [Acinetobacter baumannii]|uniref:Ig-like domain-containing protein n=1 Tax=Acinetobacter baumannii TaxID=470 RepID=UPI0013D5F1BB
SAAGSPTGSVTFKNGGTAIGSGTLSGGVASFTTSTLAKGNHTITATYEGDSNFNASTSAGLTQSVATPADSVRLRSLQVTVT